MAKYRLSPVAQQDVVDIYEHIAADKPDAALRWVEKIYAKCEMIAGSPKVGDSRPDLGTGIRSTYLGRYVIYFRSLGDVVEIVRVIPGDQNVHYL